MTEPLDNPMKRGSWSRTHGHSNPMSQTYNSWRGMLDRCRPGQPYGKLGITVCDRWLTFANFLADMGERPAGYVIDRRDVLGNYEPGNCQWRRRRENCQWRRTTVLTPDKRAQAEALLVTGATYKAIAEALGVSRTCVSDYLRGDTWGPKP